MVVFSGIDKSCLPSDGWKAFFSSSLDVGDIEGRGKKREKAKAEVWG